MKTPSDADDTSDNKNPAIPNGLACDLEVLSIGYLQLELLLLDFQLRNFLTNFIKLARKI
jgi:hypothetical protein